VVCKKPINAKRITQLLVSTSGGLNFSSKGERQRNEGEGRDWRLGGHAFRRYHFLKQLERMAYKSENLEKGETVLKAGGTGLGRKRETPKGVREDGVTQKSRGTFGKKSARSWKKDSIREKDFGGNSKWRAAKGSKSTFWFHLRKGERKRGNHFSKAQKGGCESANEGKTRLTRGSGLSARAKRDCRSLKTEPT